MKVLNGLVMTLEEDKRILCVWLFYYVSNFADSRMKVPRYQSSVTSRDHFFCFSVFSSSRGGEWYPEISGSRKFSFQSRNLGGVLNDSRNLVFLCFFASRILEFLAARSRSLGFLVFCPTVSIKTMIELFI